MMVASPLYLANLVRYSPGQNFARLMKRARVYTCETFAAPFEEPRTSCTTNSIAARPEAQVKRQELVAAHDGGESVAVRQFFRPYVLAFLALAIAVGGNGYGYKLAQYFQHSEASKASATRMWVDHRDDSSITVRNSTHEPQRDLRFRAFRPFRAAAASARLARSCSSPRRLRRV